MIRSKPTTARILLFFCFAVLVVFVMGYAQSVATSPSENSQQRPKLKAVASDSIPGPFVADEKSIRKLNEILKQRLGQESAQPHFSYKVTFSDHSYYETDSLEIVLTEENPISRQIIAIELKGTGAPIANGDDPVSALVVLNRDDMSYSIQGGDRDWVINAQTEILERLHLMSRNYHFLPEIITWVPPVPIGIAVFLIWAAVLKRRYARYRKASVRLFDYIFRLTDPLLSNALMFLTIITGFLAAFLTFFGLQKIAEYLYPWSVFAIGDAGVDLKGIESLRSTLLWGVGVALLLSVVGSIVANQLSAGRTRDEAGTKGAN
jgi:hypothetical protein